MLKTPLFFRAFSLSCFRDKGFLLYSVSRLLYSLARRSPEPVEGTKAAVFFPPHPSIIPSFQYSDLLLTASFHPDRHGFVGEYL